MNSLYRLLAANFISGLFTVITTITIPWYIINERDHFSLFSISVSIITLAGIFWSIYAGYIIDKFPKKKVFIVSYLSVSIALILSGLVGSIIDKFSEILAIGVFSLLILYFSINYPNIYAYSQHWGKGKFQKFNKLLEVQVHIMLIIGGILAVLFFKGKADWISHVIEIPENLFHYKLSLNTTYILNGIAFLISAFIASGIKDIPPHKTNNSIYTDLKAGFTYLRHRPQLLLFGCLSFVTCAIMVIQEYLLLPLFVKQKIGGNLELAGIGETVYGIGCLVAPFLVYAFFDKSKPVKNTIILMLINAAALFLTPIFHELYSYLFFIFILGFSYIGNRIYRINYLNNHIDPAFYGRATSTFSILITAFRSILLAIFALPIFSSPSSSTALYSICGLIVLLASLSIPMILKSSRLTSKKMVDSF